MQPFKPYFLGLEEPPAHAADRRASAAFAPPTSRRSATPRATSPSSRCSATSASATTSRREAIAFGWELSTRGLRARPRADLGHGVRGRRRARASGPTRRRSRSGARRAFPTSASCSCRARRTSGRPGPTGPCGPCSELYLDRGEEFGAPGDLPGDDTERFLEYWNHVFMTYELREDGSLTELPQKNIDTGMGVERMAAILQDVPSVFETDLLRAAVELAEELSGRAYGDDERDARARCGSSPTTRAGRRKLIADGVVPSNEDRGYILRRIMRRAIQQGRVLGLEPPYLGALRRARARDAGADAYPELAARARHGHALGRRRGGELRPHARPRHRDARRADRRAPSEQGTSWVDAADAFKLHDTYGFPYDLTKELLAEQGLSVDDAGLRGADGRSSASAPAAAPRRRRRGPPRRGDLVRRRSAPETRFVGYEKLDAQTSVAPRRRSRTTADGDEALVKLEESPFYAEGGGQVADSGVVRWDGGEARVARRLPRRRRPGARGRARDALPEPGPARRGRGRARDPPRDDAKPHRDPPAARRAARAARRPTCARRARAVRPDKLRFDFTHGAALTPRGAARRSRTASTSWIKASRPVRAMQMARDEAEELGAMALFGEKYGDWVRVVEVEEVSRELCGGTHVANTAEIGIFTIVSEGSSAANVRRIEALTGPAAIDWFRERSDALDEAGGAARLPARPRRRRAARGRAARRARAQRVREPARRGGGAAAERARRAERRGRRRSAVVVGARRRRRPARAARPRRPHQVEARRRRRRARRRARRQGRAGRELQRAAVERGSRAAEVVREAAAAGRRRGRGPRERRPGRRPRPRAGSTRRWRSRARAIESKLAAIAELPMRVLALDYGTARCGCAISDPSGTSCARCAVIEPPTRARSPRSSPSTRRTAWSSVCR